MKLAFIALFLALTLGSQASSTPACTYTNPIIDYLKSEQVLFHSKPSYSSTKCDNEWKVHGGCCDVKSLEKFALKDGSRVENVLQKGSEQIQNMKKDSNWYMITFNVGLEILKYRVLGQQTLSSEIKQAVLAELENARLTHYGRLDEISTWIYYNAEATIVSQEKCLKKITTLRSNAGCYACSARAPIFFTDGKLNIHENECRATIAECSDAWMKILKLLTYVRNYYKEISTLRNSLKLELSEAMVKDASSVILDWTAQINLASELAGCKDGLCNFQTTKNI